MCNLYYCISLSTHAMAAKNGNFTNYEALSMRDFYCAALYATRSFRSSSIRPSVCLSVHHTRVFWQNKRKFCWHSYTIWKGNSSSFPTRRMVGGGRPLLPENLDQTDSAASKTAISNRYSLVATHPLHLAKKSSIMTTMKSTTGFPVSLRWTAYVTPKPLEGAQKRKLAIFPLKVYFSRKSFFVWKLSAAKL